MTVPEKRNAAGFTQKSGNPAAVKLKKLYIKGKCVSGRLSVQNSSAPDKYAEGVTEDTAKDLSRDVITAASRELLIRKKAVCRTGDAQEGFRKSVGDNTPAHDSPEKTDAFRKHMSAYTPSSAVPVPVKGKRYSLKEKDRCTVSLNEDSYIKAPRSVKSRKHSDPLSAESGSISREGMDALRKSFHIKSVVKKNSLKLYGGNGAAPLKKGLVKSAPFVLIGFFMFILTAAFSMVFSSVYMSPYAVLYSAPAGSSITEIIKEINDDFLSGISDVMSETGAVSYEITGSKAVWQDMLCIYAAHSLFSSSSANVSPKESLEKIFSDMNTVTFEVHEDESEADGGSCVLSVHLSHLSLDDMASLYNFTDSEIKIMHELSSDKYLKMWCDVIYTAGVENDMVSLAASQLGNTGGEPYWSWYGYTERVPWCAIFVSWCAYLCGYTDDGSCPKFENCSSGISWFVQNGRFEGNDYIPVRGDIVFFDWEGDGISDHVGIVEYVENDIVNTIEGNAGDMCCQKQYPVSSGMIAGYGIIRR